MRIEWQLENFSLGMHSYPSRTKGGSQFASDAVNVRVDEDGHLRQRLLTRDIDAPFQKDVSGLAATRNHIFYLTGEDLWVKGIAEGGNPKYLAILRGAAGKLSIVRDFQDYLLLTTEGDDQGFWIDTRDGNNLQVHDLGFPPPGINPTVGPSYTSTLNVLTRGYKYYYRTTFVRKFSGEFWSDVPGVPDNLARRGELFDGMESNPSPAAAFTMLYDNVTTTLIQNIAHLTDNQYTGAYIYRSQQMRLDQSEADVQEYRRVAYVPKYETRLHDFMRDEDQSDGVSPRFQWAEQELLAFDNDRMPSSAKTFAFYNDRLFAPTDTRLRYSKIKYGVPQVWAFPQVNTLHVDGELDFAARYYRRLIFGGRDGLWTLAGTDAYNFQIAKTSGVGPLGPHAWGYLDKGIGFINGSGFFICDDTQAIRISSPELDVFFDETVIVGGTVVRLPSSESLWVVRTFDGQNESKRQFLLAPNEVLGMDTWFRWDGVAIEQDVLAFFDQGTEWTTPEGFYWTDSEGDFWVGVDPTDSIAHLLYTDGTQQIKEIVWWSKRSGEVDTTMKWIWETPDLLWRKQNLGTFEKLFRWLSIAGSADNPVKLSISVNGGMWREYTKRLAGDKRPIRIKANRRGTQFAVRLEGTGKVDIRGLRVVADAFVRGDW